MTKHKLRWPALIAALMLTAALGFAACGGDDDEDGGGLGVEAEEGERAQRAIEAGQDAAGEEVELEPRTIGILSIVRAIESAQRVENQLAVAASSLGWETTVCDGQGDPTETARCGDSLLDQGVDAVVTIGVEPSIIAAQMRKAEEAGVPMVQASGRTGEEPPYDGSYYPDEEAMTRVLSEEFVIPTLEELPEDEREVFVFDFAAEWAQVRTEQFREDIEGTGVEIVDEHVTDAADLDADTRRAGEAALTQYPDLKGFWVAFDSVLIPLGATVQAAFPDQEFPDRPFVAGFHADQVTQDAMQQGQIDALADQAYDISSWIAIDQLAQFFARDEEMSPEPQPEYPLEFQQAVLVTPDDLPFEGNYREEEEDAVSFFQSKWAAEFTNVDAQVDPEEAEEPEEVTPEGEPQGTGAE